MRINCEIFSSPFFPWNVIVCKIFRTLNVNAKAAREVDIYFKACHVSLD